VGIVCGCCALGIGISGVALGCYIGLGLVTLAGYMKFRILVCHICQYMARLANPLWWLIYVGCAILCHIFRPFFLILPACVYVIK
jgi:hypothetical protein